MAKLLIGTEVIRFKGDKGHRKAAEYTRAKYSPDTHYWEDREDAARTVVRGGPIIGLWVAFDLVPASELAAYKDKFGDTCDLLPMTAEQKRLMAGKGEYPPGHWK